MIFLPCLQATIKAIQLDQQVNEEEAERVFCLSGVLDSAETFISSTDPSGRRAANRRVLRAAKKIGVDVGFKREELYTDSD